MSGAPRRLLRLISIFCVLLWPGADLVSRAAEAQLVQVFQDNLSQFAGVALSKKGRSDLSSLKPLLRISQASLLRSLGEFPFQITCLIGAIAGDEFPGGINLAPRVPEQHAANAAFA